MYLLPYITKHCLSPPPYPHVACPPCSLPAFLTFPLSMSALLSTSHIELCPQGCSTFSPWGKAPPPTYIKRRPKSPPLNSALSGGFLAITSQLTQSTPSSIYREVLPCHHMRLVKTRSWFTFLHSSTSPSCYIFPDSHVLCSSHRGTSSFLKCAMLFHACKTFCMLLGWPRIFLSVSSPAQTLLLSKTGLPTFIFHAHGPTPWHSAA
jgi:hypothetical protein